MTLKSRIAYILFVIYLGFTLIRWHFQYWTGTGAIWLGFKISNWIQPEYGHIIMIYMIRWTYWQPKWVNDVKPHST